jgi:glucosamine--fructose-6-phosphate aminotransferase (isomerizing)
MCGIVGAVAQRDVVPILIEGLKRLEYRGYDSAGVAIIDANGQLDRVRRPGKVAMVDSEARERLHGGTGIAHTRWATHGIPNEQNAHPHICRKTVAVVHNGIIENHEQLRAEQKKKGFEFTSQTDTEVIVHQIYGYHVDQGLDLLTAVKRATADFKGAYALGVVSTKEPGRLVVARLGSPLVIGIGVGEHFIASDVAALLPVTQKFIFLHDGDVADITRDSLALYDASGARIERPVRISELTANSVARGEYRHYMLKEIFEQPRALAETGIPASVEVASEFRYRRPVVRKNSLIVTISQSGETADTIAGLQEAKRLGFGHSLAICNVPESTLVRESDLTLMTRAGPEIGVASTKAFTTQLVALMLLVIALGRRHGLKPEVEAKLVAQLRELPGAIERVLLSSDSLKKLAEQFADKQHALFLGRGTMYPVAMEGALKLKEISYIHAEAYPAGELKHGPLALVDAAMPVIAVAPNDELLEKLKSNLQEVRARGGELIVFADPHSGVEPGPGVQVFDIAPIDNALAPIVYTVPLQLLAYHVAVLKGTDVDKPRNLAKSVTVE